MQTVYIVLINEKTPDAIFCKEEDAKELSRKLEHYHHIFGDYNTIKTAILYENVKEYMDSLRITSDELSEDARKVLGV
jgi:hypothetical protein